MADVLKERSTEAPPFTHCGMDMFRRFVIRERRSEMKQYCALFTCFASRAFHIVVVNVLDTDSFVQDI